MYAMITRRLGLRVTAALLFIAVTLAGLSGCLQPAPAAAPTPAEESAAAKDFYNRQISELYDSLTGQLPAEYTAALPEVALAAREGEAATLTVSGSDVFGYAADKYSVTAAAEQAKVSLIYPAALPLLRSMAQTAAGMTDAENAALVESTLTEIESQAAQATTLEALYNCLLSAEERLFGCIDCDLTAENAEQMSVSPVLYYDESGVLWLKLYTNFPLPALSDPNTGFSLMLTLDNGKTFQTTADSIYKSGDIAYDGIYCVRFNLTQMLSGMSAEEFFSGRNRVIFSLYTLDNSVGFTQDFYRMSLSGAVTGNESDVYLTLLQIAAAYTLQAP